MSASRLLDIIEYVELRLLALLQLLFSKIGNLNRPNLRDSRPLSNVMIKIDLARKNRLYSASHSYFGILGLSSILPINK